MSKDLYRIKCKALAVQIAKRRLNPLQIANFISKQRWFMQLQGVKYSSKGLKIKKNSPLNIFGREWCDQCMSEELIRTGIYKLSPITNNPADIRTFYGLSLI
jgi:hypothetical protein